MDEDERSDLIRKLFYLLTARLEDAATIAAEGQGSALGNELLVTHADCILSVSREVEIIAQAVTVLIGNDY